MLEGLDLTRSELTEEMQAAIDALEPANVNMTHRILAMLILVTARLLDP